jgi:NADH-quinone oxidoreductase subunit J
MVEVIVFAFFAVIAIAGALVMVMARNPVYSAIGLLTTMFSIAVFYVLQNAQFIAAIQVLIYAGAVMTLFLFVIMLIGVDKSEDTKERIPYQRPWAIAVSVGFAAVILIAGAQAWITGNSVFGVSDLNGTIETVADALFGTWMLAFLSTIFLLTIAAVGSIALAHYGPTAEEEP